MNLKKRGLSQVIATVLLVLLTVAAAAILIAFIVPYVKNNLYESTECTAYRDYFKFDESFKKNCYIDTTGSKRYDLTIKSIENSQENAQKIGGLVIYFFSEETGTTKSVVIREGNSEPPGVTMFGGVSNLKVPSNGAVFTYSYSDSALYTKMEIAPLLVSGTTCPKADSINLNACVINP